MEFGSISRRKSKGTNKQDPRARRSFSTSNLSFTSSNYSTTSIGRRSLYLTLPKDFGCERGSDGRVLHMKKGGPAHSSGVIQIGDFVRVYDSPISGAGGGGGESGGDDMVTVHVTYGALEVESRPPCPLAIKIGNKSSTSLGIALGDTIGNQVKITSIQTGSLADRCGFLVPGDILTSIQISSNETVPCSPYYTSYQIAQILRQLASHKTSVTLTIVPIDEIIESSCSDNNSVSVSGGSTVTLRDHDNDRDSPVAVVGGTQSNQKKPYALFSKTKTNSNNICKTFLQNSRRLKVEEEDEDEDKEVTEDGALYEEEEEEERECENECVLSLCLWKDRLYEDWGFSLIDDEGDNGDDNDEATTPLTSSTVHEESTKRISRKNGKKRSGAFVHQIRPGGPAFQSGLRSGDRFLQINERNVANLESTMLVPILASLDCLNLIISRKVS